MSEITVLKLRLAIEKVHKAVPAVKLRLGESSKMYSALRGLEDSLALLLRQASAKGHDVREFMDRKGALQFESQLNQLNLELSKNETASSIQHPVLNVILSVEPMVKELKAVFR